MYLLDYLLILAQQVIEIYVVDIPECYGMLLSRDWSSQLGGYFTIDWSHMLIPKKDQNQY